MMSSKMHKAFNIMIDDGGEEEMIETMLTNNKVHLLYDALGQEIQPLTSQRKEKEVEAVTTTTTTKTIHTLFEEYMQDDFLDKLRLSYSEIYDLFAERALPLREQIEEDKPVILEIIDAFVTRMVLNMAVQDKVALKVRLEMVERVEALYDHRGGETVPDVKNDWNNYDYVTGMINARVKEARNQETDEIYMRFSEPKRRGRHPKVRAEELTNEIETFAGEYIAKRLSMAQAGSGSIDYYPIFVKTLETYDKCTPKMNNHGLYLQNLLHCIRTLDSRVWPLHGLMKTANNLNYCVHAESVKMKFDRTKRRFYCCYSGKEIKDGETVTCLRVVENDAQRLKEWRENPTIIGKPFEAPEFTRSVYAYYMKKELCCASTLFFTPFSERYKAHFPEYFAPPSVSTVTTTTKTKRTKKPKRKAEAVATPEKKKKPRVEEEEEEEEDSLFGSLSTHATVGEATTLRHCMARLSSHHGDPACVYHGEKRYSATCDAIGDVLKSVTKKSFIGDLHNIISGFTTTTEEVSQCYDAVLDFTEALLMPEKKPSSYASVQKDVGIRAILYATCQRIKARSAQDVNPFTLLARTDQITASYWIKKCPLLFLSLFRYMASHESEAYLSIVPSGSLNCDAMFRELNLRHGVQ